MERVRTTISLDPEVHEVFRRMAEASGVSISRCMGDWLADTIDAAQLATNKLVEIRRSPERVIHDFNSLLASEALAIMQGKGSSPIDMRKLGDLARGRPAADSASAGPPPAGRAPTAPSSNTGLKSPTPRPGKRK